MGKISVLHVDDSAVIRGIIGKILQSDTDVDLIESAANGQLGVEAYKKHKPDLVVMDIEMPIMNGIEALEKIIEFDKDAKVIMCSTLTVDNAEITMQAMKIGAIDYIPKPTSAGEVGGSKDFREKLLFLVKNMKGPSAPAVNDTPAKIFGNHDYELRLRHAPSWKPSVLAIGSSTGGPQALFDVMKDLKNVTVPIVITQHMPPTFTTLLAKHITDQAGFECLEAEDGMVLKPGQAILARGGKHMNFEKNVAGQVVVKLDDGPVENFCKPAVDSMYRSLLKIYGGNILSVILTGMGHDGRDGAKDIIDAGGYCIAQDEATSVVWGMPGAVATAGLCSAVLPLADIAPWIKNNIRF
jgi:two-component system chemotaxis response regulator CheB